MYSTIILLVNKVRTCESEVMEIDKCRSKPTWFEGLKHVWPISTLCIWLKMYCVYGQQPLFLRFYSIIMCICDAFHSHSLQRCSSKNSLYKRIFCSQDSLNPLNNGWVCWSFKCNIIEAKLHVYIHLWLVYCNRHKAIKPFEHL